MAQARILRGQVRGLDDVGANLKALFEDASTATGKNALRRGLVQALEPMADTAKGHAAHHSGELQADIIITTKPPRGVTSAGRQAFAIAKRYGKSNTEARGAARSAAAGEGAIVRAYLGVTGRAARYAHLVERGSKPHEIDPRADGKAVTLWEGGTRVGASAVVEHPGAKPQPFMRNSFEEKAQAVIEAAGPHINDQIQTSAARAAKKRARRGG